LIAGPQKKVRGKKQTSKSDGKRRILREEIVKAIRCPLMSQKEFASDSYILSFQEVGDMIKHHTHVLSTPLPYKLTLRKAYTPILRCSRFKKFCRAQTGGGWWDYINCIAA